jgi:hypothetical protein
MRWGCVNVKELEVRVERGIISKLFMLTLNPNF